MKITPTALKAAGNTEKLLTFRKGPYDGKLVYVTRLRIGLKVGISIIEWGSKTNKHNCNLMTPSIS